MGTYFTSELFWLLVVGLDMWTYLGAKPNVHGTMPFIFGVMPSSTIFAIKHILIQCKHANGNSFWQNTDSEIGASSLGRTQIRWSLLAFRSLPSCTIFLVSSNNHAKRFARQLRYEYHHTITFFHVGSASNRLLPNWKMVESKKKDFKQIKQKMNDLCFSLQIAKYCFYP